MKGGDAGHRDVVVRLLLRQSALIGVIIDIRMAWALRYFLIEKQLSLNELKCYYLFLCEYFSLDRGQLFKFPKTAPCPRDEGFSSKAKIAELLADRADMIEMQTGKKLISKNRPDILKAFDNLERKNLIARRLRKKEIAQHPELFSALKNTHKKKTHFKHSYQPTGDDSAALYNFKLIRFENPGRVKNCFNNTLQILEDIFEITDGYNFREIPLEGWQGLPKDEKIKYLKTFCQNALVEMGIDELSAKTLYEEVYQ